MKAKFFLLCLFLVAMLISSLQAQIINPFSVAIKLVYELNDSIIGVVVDYDNNYKILTDEKSGGMAFLPPVGLALTATFENPKPKKDTGGVFDCIDDMVITGFSISGDLEDCKSKKHSILGGEKSGSVIFFLPKNRNKPLIGVSIGIFYLEDRSSSYKKIPKPNNIHLTKAIKRKDGSFMEILAE